MRKNFINIQLFAEEKPENDNEEMSDISLAELANKELKEKEELIKKLEKQLAIEKLHSSGEENNEENIMSREDCINQLNKSNISNYDYAVAVCGLVDAERAEGNPNPLGSKGDEVYDFLKGCIEECDGDKHNFVAIYQARLGKDDNKVSAAFNSRKK